MVPALPNLASVLQPSGLVEFPGRIVKILWQPGHTSGCPEPSSRGGNAGG